jgi:hypothetical protein
MLRGEDFIEPPVATFATLLNQQSGGGFYTSPHIRQRGFGFLSFLRGVASHILPFLKHTVLPAAAPALGQFTSGVLSDLSSGGLKSNFKSRMKQAANETVSGVRRAQTGSGRCTKRQRKPKRAPVTKRRSKQTDVFSTLVHPRFERSRR